MILLYDIKTWMIPTEQYHVFLSPFVTLIITYTTLAVIIGIPLGIISWLAHGNDESGWMHKFSERMFSVYMGISFFFSFIHFLWCAILFMYK